MRIDFDKLTCRSVIGDSARRLAPRTAPEGFRDPIPVAECADPLYLPSVIDKGQSLCILGRDTVPIEAILDPSTLDFVKSRRRKAPAHAPYQGEFEVATSDLRVAILGNVFSRNFFHWFEEMLKAAVIESLGLDCHYVLADLPPFAPALLRAMGVAPERVVSPEGPTLFRSAIFTPAVSLDSVAEVPFPVAMLRQALLGPLEGRRSPHSRRLWLERGQMVRNGGATLNPEEAHACVRSHGFEILDMATLSVEEQLAAVKDAEAIAGPHGAQFVHALLLPPRSKVIECFSPMHVNPCMLATCRLLGHSYAQVVARSHFISSYPHGRDLVVDVEHLSLALDRLFGDLSPSAPVVAPAGIAGAKPRPGNWRNGAKGLGSRRGG